MYFYQGYKKEGGKKMCFDRSSSPAVELNLANVAIEGVKRFLREKRIFKVRAEPKKARKFEIFLTTNIEAPPEWLYNFSIVLIVKTATGRLIPIRYRILKVNGDGVSYRILVTPKTLRDLFLAYCYLKVLSGYSSNVQVVQFAVGNLTLEVKNSY